MAKLTRFSPQLILRVAIPVPLYRLFDYLAPDDLDLSLCVPGVRLEVPFGTGKKLAYLMEVSDHSDISAKKLKQIVRILDDKPLLSPQDLHLLSWASSYYHHPVGDVFNTAFPTALRQGKPANVVSLQSFCLTDLGKALSLEQLNRAPKQKKLLAHFQHSNTSFLSEAELAHWDKNWRSSVQQLISKALINRVETGNAETATPLVFKTVDPLPLNSEQQSAIKAVTKALGQFEVFLLEGVTGSGKTEIYIQLIQTVLARGQQVIVLVPEINLTPQLEERFRQRFVVAMTLFHSNLTEKQRHTAWVTMQNGTNFLLLGTRSALFTPLKNPGLIILDEEHDASFKQQEGFRFSARDVAIMRGKLLNIPVVLGSATPSLESLHNAQKQRYRHLTLLKRAGKAIPPTIQLLDIRNKKLQQGLSELLIQRLRSVLANKEQVLLFLNRRGFAPTLICHGCGWVARCKQCDANLVIHDQAKKLRCHHCGKEQRLVTTCPACQADELMPLGLGTERIENALRELFPDNSLVRLDRDSIRRKGSLEHYLAQINEGKVDIILGTQMLAKGHHFPNVTLVAIVDVDSGLFSIDYRATERLAQLIVQVSGRAGRTEKRGHVILQTRHPDHPLLNTLINEGYNRFAAITLAERKQALLPPFSYQALMRAQAENAQLALDFLQATAKIINTASIKHTQVLGPIAAPMEKRGGMHRYQLLFQSSKRNDLQQCLFALINAISAWPQTKKIHWSLDVDPIDHF